MTAARLAASVSSLAVAVIWALAAVWALDGAQDYISDGFCFRGEPGWRYGQAAIAAAGVVAVLVSSGLAFRAARGRGRLPVRWFVAAATLLAAWIGVLVFLVAPLSFAESQPPLPAVYCTY